MRHLYTLVVAVVLLNSVAILHAQTSTQTPATPTPIRCYTTEMEAQRRAQNPKMQSTEAFEQWMAAELKKRTTTGANKSMATRVIPTVVHVIYSNATENISTAQVQSQIDILNEDFQRLNPDTTNTPAAFQAVAVDSDIEFCLAQIDPNGNSTTGINRVSMAGSPFSFNFIENTIKPATIWDPNQYFNFWVVNVQGGILGWAQFPEAATLPGIGTGNGGANTDGVVCLHTSVGRPPANPFGGPYNLGRTATHEVGHWLGLRHIWGDGGCGVDDFCADTPESDGSNFGCPTTHMSCGTTDMVQNYMDYTDDACMNLFTADQKARMDVVLGGSVRRASLLTSSVCSTSPEIIFVNTTTTMTENGSSGATACRGFQDFDIALRIGGPPTGDATVTMTTVSGSATLGVDYDIIVGVVVFPSGATGNQTFRIRVYDDGAIETPEDLTIGFTISGATDAYAGTPNQHTLNINDNDQIPDLKGSFVLLTEDFEGGGAGWTVQNLGGQNQWVVSGANGGMTGARSAYVSRNGTANAYNRNNASDSRLRSPLINGVGQSGMTLTFDFKCQGEFAAGTYWDYGRLSYSLDGTNFTNIVGNATATPFGLQATPVSYTVTLPAAVDNQNYYLGWEWENDNNTGTNPPFTIDEVQITAQGPVPVETTLNSTRTEYLGPFSTVYWYDQTTGDVLLSIDNPTAFDYGCTSVTIDREGTGATPYNDPNMSWAVTDKTYLVTPTNNNPIGAYTIRLYYTAAEILGWETASTQSRLNINVAKTGGPISNITPSTPLANGPTNYYGLAPVRGTYNGTDFWVEADFTTGFSGFAGGIENTGPVPVEFADIFAQWTENGAEITWEIGNFSNLKEFQVERSVAGSANSGRDDGQFTKVGTKYPASPTGNGGTYTFPDRDILSRGFGEVFYRIKAVDYDGAFKYSETRRLIPDQTVQANLWPNPFTDELHLLLQLSEAADIDLTIHNAIGQEVAQRSFSGQLGTNRLEIGEALQHGAGVYFIRVHTGTAARVLKVVKGE